MKNRPQAKRIACLIKKYKYIRQTDFSNIEQIVAAHRKSVLEYNEFKRHATQECWSHLESLAKELDTMSGKGIAHHFKILKHNEQSKEYFRQIRRCEGKGKGGSVDKILVETPEGEKVAYDKNRIEDEIIRVNKEKLLQAKYTPLRSDQLSILLGEQGDFKKWEEILRGTIQLPPDLGEELHLWYQYITTVEHDPMVFQWTTQEYCDSWKQIDENKTTLPGIQVAHIKSLDSSSAAATVLSKLALLPLVVGYSPKTWRNGIDAMIPKKIADLRPSKLRLILLMDAHFNHNNKLIGKKMMEYGEQHKMLAPEQFGSRKCKSAIEHALNKRLVTDILRQSGTKAIYIANDAKACYDRIILMVAYITMRNFGIPSLVAQSTISSILRMKHRVRTCFGDSTKYYGGDKWTTLPHGCGQGNGYGPALWACISSPLLHILRNQGYGTKLVQPISRTPIHIAAFSFVDDTDIIQTEDKSDTDPILPPTQRHQITNLFTMTQQAINTWSHTLIATGGELESSKTFCVPIIPEWKGSKRILQKDTPETFQIHLTNPSGQQEIIQKQNANDSFFTLGIWQSPSGHEDRQVQHLLSIIEKWNVQTTRDKLTWFQARLASTATIGKTLMYSLPATALSDKDCMVLQRKLQQAILGKMGVVRTTPSLLATAPTSLGGFGLFSFEIAQLCEHISILFLHGPNRESITGSLLRSTMETYALEAGLPGDPLLMHSLGYVTPHTWIHQTVQALHKYQITIKSDIAQLKTWTTQDAFIMQALQPRFSTQHLMQINKVRLYLRVVTLSDLLSADGRHIDAQLLQGNRGTCHPTPSTTAYHWPSVPPPSKTEKELWKQALCTVYGVSASNLMLPSCSNNTHWMPHTIDKAQWLLDQDNGVIYQKTGQYSWTRWVPTTHNFQYSTRSTSNPYKVQDIVHDIPTCSIISVNQRGPFTYVATVGKLSTEQIRPMPHTLAQSSLSTSDSLFLYHISLGNGSIFSDVVIQPPCLTCSLNEVDFTNIQHLMGSVTGSAEDTNSYRAELAGILHSIQYINRFCWNKATHSALGVI